MQERNNSISDLTAGHWIAGAGASAAGLGFVLAMVVGHSLSALIYILLIGGVVTGLFGATLIPDQE